MLLCNWVGLHVTTLTLLTHKGRVYFYVTGGLHVTTLILLYQIGSYTFYVTGWDPLLRHLSSPDRGGAATVVAYTSSIRYAFLNINLCTQVYQPRSGGPTRGGILLCNWGTPC